MADGSTGCAALFTEVPSAPHHPVREAVIISRVQWRGEGTEGPLICPVTELGTGGTRPGSLEPDPEPVHTGKQDLQWVGSVWARGSCWALGSCEENRLDHGQVAQALKGAPGSLAPRVWAPQVSWTVKLKSVLEADTELLTLKSAK